MANTRHKTYQHSYQTGILAEWVCIAKLWLTGWRILNRRWRNHAGEIDIVAVRGKQVIFVEVKARRKHDDALHSIHPAQKLRIMNAANGWVAKHADYSSHAMRFDVMSVALWPWPKHLANAFEQ